MKVLVAVDGSIFTKHAVNYLLEHFDMVGRDSSVTLINVHSPIPPHAAAHLGRETVQQYYADESEKVLKGPRNTLAKAGVKTSEVMRVGDPGDEIAEHATKGKFDIVIMGSHGRGLFKNLVLGSVATKVLAGCKVPVLLIR
ncbi:MAG: universal stress protein [Burkholderiales bacterium]|nr:universal stress protein [Burkholderiales bacterium]